jgi:PAS domain S-box-containing protein
MDDARKTKAQLLQELARLRGQVAGLEAARGREARAGLPDYAEVFEEIPLPATLTDAQGMILDVNRAFLAHARSLGRQINKADRVGRSVYDFADTEEERAHLDSLLGPLRRGEQEHLSKIARYLDRRWHYEEVRAAALRDPAGQVAGMLLLREDVTAKVIQEERRQVLLRLEEEVWRMAAGDGERLMTAVREGLERLGLPFRNCGVNLVEAQSDPPLVRFHTMAPGSYWTFASPEDQAAKIVLGFWRAQQVVYRKDLEQEDLYGERDNVRRDHGPAIRCIVDVPFLYGTLAVNSAEPAAFTPEDIEILQDMARVLSEGFQRLEDLRVLEERNRELRREIAGHQRAEERLAQTEKRYQQLFEEAPAIYVITRNQDGQPLIADCNGQFLAALGYHLAEVVNRPLADFYTPESRARLLGEEGYRHSLAGHVVADERQLVARDGRVIETLLRAVPEFDEAGRVIGTRAMFADITERKQAEAQAAATQRVREAVWRMENSADIEKVMVALSDSLRQGGIRFSTFGVNLVEAAADPVILHFYNLDREGRWTDIRAEGRSEAVDLILQVWRSGAAAHRPDLDAEDAHGEGRHIHEVFGYHVRSVIDLPFAQGTLAVNSTRPNAFSDQDVVFLKALAEVLSEGFQRLEDLKRLEAERRRAEEALKLNLALQQVRNEVLQMQDEEDWQALVVVVLAQLQTLVRFNACSINRIDYQAGTSEVYYLDASGLQLEMRPGLVAAFKQARETGRHVYRRTQEEMRRYGDSPELLELQIRSVLDVPFSGGTIAANSLEEEAFTARDIEILEQFAQVMNEAHRRLEDLKALRLSDRQLHQAQKMEAVGKLAGGVAHDFNNLITVIIGYGELLLRRFKEDQRAQDSLQEIQQAAERGAALVRQLLAFSRRQVLEPRVLDLNAVVKGLEKMLRRLIGEDVELRTTLEPGLGRVKADPGQVEQVLMNLATNARDAMPQGGRLSIETRNAEVDAGAAQGRAPLAPGPYALLEVADTGMGMSPEVRERIFEPFFTTKEPGKGTGLGLATVYGIVKQSGGYIYVRSEPGQGSVFEIYLPRVAGEAAGEARAGERASPAPGGSETVLVVEDEEAVRRMMAQVLRGQGYRVLEAGGGEAALQAAARHAGPLHLLVTDVVMPGMNGRQLAEQLAAQRPGVRVLYVSGYAEGIIEERGVLAPQVAFLRKPFTSEGLAARVRQVLDERAGPGRSAGDPGNG